MTTEREMIEHSLNVLTIAVSLLDEAGTVATCRKELMKLLQFVHRVDAERNFGRGMTVEEFAPLHAAALAEVFNEVRRSVDAAAHLKERLADVHAQVAKGDLLRALELSNAACDAEHEAIGECLATSAINEALAKALGIPDTQDPRDAAKGLREEWRRKAIEYSLASASRGRKPGDP